MVPEPLTPPDCDLRDFGFMPFDVVRFDQSDLVAFEDPEAVLAAVRLWGKAWHAVPAGSLTNDDRALANLAGYGRAVESFRAIKAGALRGFVECSDGRLYHPVVAEKALEAWAGKLKQRHRTFCAAVRKHNERFPDDRRDTPSFDEWQEFGRPAQVTLSTAPRSRETDPSVTRDADGGHAAVTRADASKGQGQGQGQGQGDSIDDDGGDARARANPVAILDPFDGFVDSCARAAGVAHLSPTRIASNLDRVREWLGSGLTRDEVIATIAERVEAATEPIHSLRHFDAAMRQTLARRENRANGSARPNNHPRSRPGSRAEEMDDAVRRRLAAGEPDHRRMGAGAGPPGH